MTGKNVLVTGASGFIGSHLTKKLVELGNGTNVFIRPKSDTKRLSSVLDKITVFEADLTEAHRVSDVVKQITPDIIFHLAGSGVHSYSGTSASCYRELIKSNIEGTLNLLEAATKSGCQLFVNTGSCYEYGSKHGSFSEDDHPRPLNMYGGTKAAVTCMAELFHQNNQLPVVTVRPFTVYGPEEDHRRFISSVIIGCLQGKNPKLTEKSIVRDFIYIDDVINAYIQIAENGNKVAGEVMNVSTGKATNLKEAAALIIHLTKADVAIDFGGYPTRPGEVEFLVGNPAKAERLLSWKAESTLEKGLINTISWIKGFLK